MDRPFLKIKYLNWLQKLQLVKREPFWDFILCFILYCSFMEFATIKFNWFMCCSFVYTCYCGIIVLSKNSAYVKEFI